MKKINIIISLSLLCLTINLQAQIEKDSTLESILDYSIEELMNTKVNIATKSEQKLSEVPSIVTVINSEQIINSGARNILDILQYIPGFEFSKPRIGFHTAGIRGVKDPLTNSRFLVLKDGVQYNGNMYGSGIGNQKQFDLNTIDRIEIIRGPGSALYGRNAFIGVINIITKEGVEKNGLNLSSSIGNFNTYYYNGSFETKKENLNTYFAVEKIISDNTDSKYDNGMGGKSIWNISSDNLFLNSRIQYKNFEFIGMFSNIINGASTGPFITETYKNTKIGLYSILFNKKISKKTHIDAKIYGRNEYQIQNIEIFKPGITAEAAPNVPFSAIYPNGLYVTPQFKSYTYGADLSFALNLIEKHNTLIGIQTDFYGLMEVELKSSYDTYTGAPLTYLDNGVTVFRGKYTQLKEERGWIEGNGHDYSNIAFYIQNIYSPINNLSFTIGGRYDIDSEFGAVFNPRLAIVWNTNRKLIFKLLYGQAFRAPNSQEQYRKTGFTIGNKDLKPETIKTTELSLDYNITKNISNRLILFYNLIEDMIYAQGITSGTPGSPYSNIGSNESMGFEYEYKMMLNKVLYTYINYSFTSSMNKVKSNNLLETFTHRDIAPHKINVGFNYKYLKYFNLNTNILYRSEREKYFAIDKVTGDYVLDSNGNKTFVSQDEIGNYFLINTKLRINNFFKSLEFSASIFNVLDTEYYDQDSEYSSQPAGEGRQYIFTLSYKF